MSKNTGGPAFPVTAEQSPSGAFPMPGMDLRDYFAARAMATLLSSEYTSQHGLHEGWHRELAYEAYVVADAMLKARMK